MSTFYHVSLIDSDRLHRELAGRRTMLEIAALVRECASVFEDIRLDDSSGILGDVIRARQDRDGRPVGSLVDAVVAATSRRDAKSPLPAILGHVTERSGRLIVRERTLTKRAVLPPADLGYLTRGEVALVGTLLEALTFDHPWEESDRKLLFDLVAAAQRHEAGLHWSMD
jgi:hypothetical protein